MKFNFLPRAVIFDFDGVVVDSLGSHLAAWTQACHEILNVELLGTHGLPGRSTLAIARVLSERFGRPELAETLMHRKRSIMASEGFGIDVFPGVSELLQTLKARKVPVAIGSNATRSFIDSILPRTDLEFPVICTIDDVEQPKPAPDVYLLAAKKLGISHIHHHEIVVLEDSPHGLRAAVKAGMYAVGIASNGLREELIAEKAKFVVDHTGDIMSCF
jgi:HAD superfamily hydrolase (TIGR01509 family)